MGKSKKRVRYDSGRESDHLRTQAGIDANNVGAAIEAAIEQSNAAIASEITVSTEGEVEQTTPATSETGTAEQATPASATTEEPTKEPQTDGACKPVPHWSANPSVEFRNANTEFLTLMSEVGTTEEDIKTTEEYILSQGSEEDALKIILTSTNQYKSLINQTKPTEEKEMADNNTNPNNTASNNDANNNAAAMAAAMQNQAMVATAPTAAAGMSTTEKVVLYTAAGVAVVGLIVGVVALAKAAKANNAIANMGDGIL